MPSKKKRRGRIAPAEQLRLAALAEEIAGVGHWYWHLGNGRIYWSDETARIHGHTPGRFEPSLEATIAAYHPEDRARVLQHLAEAQAGPADFDFEARLARPDGSWRRVHVQGRCQTNAKGDAEALVGIVRDITDRIEEAPAAPEAVVQPTQAESQADHRGALEALIENIDYGVLILDADLHVRAANPAFCALSAIPERLIATWPPLGVVVEQAVTNGFRDPEDPDRPLDPTAYLAAVEAGSFGPVTLPCDDGRLLDHDCVVLPDRGRLLIFRDVTAAGAAPGDGRDREAANEPEGTAPTAPGLPPAADLLAALARKLELPAKGVASAAALLLDSDLDQEQHQFALMAHEAGADLAASLDQLLTLSAIAAGQLGLADAEFDLPDLVDQALAEVASLAAGKGIELAAYLAPDVPKTLSGDGGQVQRILVHLLRNALRFTEAGGVALEVTHEADSAEVSGVRLRFDVADTGVGMPDGQPDALQAGPDAAGRGLGLFICRQRAEAMGGRLGIASAPGRGSRIWFTARLSGAREFATEPWFEALAGPLPEARILVVDDNDVSRQVLEKQLRGLGFEVEGVADARVALDNLDRSAEEGEPFALAFVDHDIPELGGVELCRLIREPARESGLRLVLAASSTAVASDVQARQVNADFALPKPLSPKALALCLEKAFGPDARAPIRDAPAPEAATPAPKTALHVLLVDDDPLNRRLTVELLKGDGHRVDAVATGYEATDALRDLPYDLVIMDIQMPQMDGLETARRIRESGHHRADVPIIVMTGRALDGDRDRCLLAGANDYIVKPVDPAVLLEKVRHWGGIEPPVAAAGADGEGPAGLNPAAPDIIAS